MLLFLSFFDNVLHGPYWLDSVVAGPDWPCVQCFSKSKPESRCDRKSVLWASGGRNPKPQVAKLLKSRGLGCTASEATSASEPYLVVPIVSIAVPFWGYLLGSLI